MTPVAHCLLRKRCNQWLVWRARSNWKTDMCAGHDTKARVLVTATADKGSQLFCGRFFLLLTMPCVFFYPSISSTTCTRGVRKHRSPTLPLLHKRVQGSRQTYGTCREAPMLITTTSTTPQKNKLLVWGMKKSSEKSL